MERYPELASITLCSLHTIRIFMVELVVLQSLSYMAGALGVCIAAIYYVINLREANKNRKMALTTSLMQSLISEDGNQRWIELMNMQWTDFDDFYKKYDSTVNPDNWAKRNTMWNAYEVLGYQYRQGVIDMGTLDSALTMLVTQMWAKFKPIIDEYKKFEWPNNTYENWEFLASEMRKLEAVRDPEFQGAQGAAHRTGQGVSGRKYLDAFKS